MAAINNKTSKGLLGTKLGMTQVWTEQGKLVPVTVIQVAPNVVTQVRTPEKDGYSAVQIAAGQIDPRKVTKPLEGHFEAAGVTPRRHVTEVRTADAADYSLGQELTVFDARNLGLKDMGRMLAQIQSITSRGKRCIVVLKLVTENATTVPMAQNVDATLTSASSKPVRQRSRCARSSSMSRLPSIRSKSDTCPRACST